MTGATVEPRAAAAFVELLRVASTTADGVTALVDGYRSLTLEERARIIDAIAESAVEPEVVLHAFAAILAVETDLARAERIADRMRRVLPTPGPGSRAEPAAGYVTGDESAGAIVVARPLHGGFVEALAVAWSSCDGAFESSYVPLIHDDETAAFVRAWSGHLEGGGALRAAPVGDVMELLASVAWTRHRTTGLWPDGLARFSDLLVARG